MAQTAMLIGIFASNDKTTQSRSNIHYITVYCFVQFLRLLHKVKRTSETRFFYGRKQYEQYDLGPYRLQYMPPKEIKDERADDKT